MDIVLIEDLKVDAIIGILEWERRVPQELIINIEMGVDIRPAAQSECIDDALDYSAVVARVKAFVVESQFQLLETLAEKTTALIMSEFSVPWMRFSCKKTQVMLEVGGVGVSIERGER